MGDPFNRPDIPFNRMGDPFNRTGLPFNRTGLPFNRTGLPFNRTGLPFNRTGLPFNRTDVPFNRTDLTFAWIKRPFGSPAITIKLLSVIRLQKVSIFIQLLNPTVKSSAVNSLLIVSGKGSGEGSGELPLSGKPEPAVLFEIIFHYYRVVIVIYSCHSFFVFIIQQGWINIIL
jgi:hypothetical protein